MNKEAFEKYLKERYYPQIEWYDRKAELNHGWYKLLQWGLIILSALTPVLIAINFGFPENKILKWIPIISSVMVAILAASLKTFKFQENWINYRTTCETLKKEIYFYEAGIYDYATSENKEATFVERVENLISRENTLWLSLHKEGKKRTNHA